MRLFQTTIIFLLINVLINKGVSSDDTDNNIDTNESHGFHLEKNWIKMTKTPPFKVIQVQGIPVELVCEVMGSQIPTIQWFVGHLPRAELDHFESNHISEYSLSAIVRVQSIYILDRLLSSPQTYTCVGRTGSKTVFASSIIYPYSDSKIWNVQRESFSFGPQKPKIIYSEKLHLDLIGSNIQLPCKIYSREPTDILWMNGDGKIVQQNNHFKVLTTGDLLISKVRWEDMGLYKCIAKNAIGKDYSDTFVYPVLEE